MPRIYSSVSDPIDFCRDCFPSEDEAEEKYGNVGDGPDGRGNCFSYDDMHPDYGGEAYHCEDCNKILTDEDNDAADSSAPNARARQTGRR